MIAIRPNWCEKIASRRKTIEVRKSAPKEVPFKAYIYATKPKKFYKCGAVSTSDELLWLANGKIEMCDGFKFWADSDVYQGLNGRVIGEFVCDKVDTYNFHEGLVAFNSMGLPSGFYGSYLIFADDYKSMCLSYDEVKNYGKGKTLYGLHISDLKIYDKPKKLSEFISSKPKNKFRAHGDNLTHPPQSWIYVEDKNE